MTGKAISRKILNPEVIAFLLRISVGFLFFFSGTLKLLDITNFQTSLEKFNLLANNLIPIFSYLLVFTEIILGALFTIKFRPVLLSQSLSVLLVIFTAVISSKIIEGETLNCGCFGNIIDGRIDSFTIIRNIILIVICIFLAAHYTNKKKDKTVGNEKHESIKETSNYIYKYMINLTMVLLFFFITVQCIILAHQNRILKDRLKIIVENDQFVLTGQTVNHIKVINMNGKEEILFNGDGDKIILFLFSVDCGACSLNFNLWQGLDQTLKNNGVNIKTVAISLDPIVVTKKYIEIVKPDFEVYSIKNINDIETNFRTMLTPQTILINEDRKIENIWVGILGPYQIYGIIKRL